MKARTPPSRRALPARCCHRSGGPEASDVGLRFRTDPRRCRSTAGLTLLSPHAPGARPCSGTEMPAPSSSVALFLLPRKRRRVPRGVATPGITCGSRGASCASVAGAPKDPTTTARGLRPHRCGRGVLLGSDGEPPSPKARSRRAGQARIATRGPKALRRTPGAGLARAYEARWSVPEGTSHESAAPTVAFAALGRATSSGVRCRRVTTSASLVGPSTRPVRVSPPGRARRASRRHTDP